LIYLDWAATSPICDAAKKAVIEHLDDFGNPSSNHELGRQVRVLVEDARERIAKCINAESDEIYFTSGGSEANSWALHRRISVSSNFEHHSVNARLKNAWVDTNGFVKTEFFEHINHSLAGYFDLGACIMVNNEIGTIQPVKDIANILHNKNRLCHIDAVQAVGHIPVDVKDLNCDTLSASGHKFGAPKGVGFLYAKNGIELNQLINGGHQEFSKRGGTENTLGIISMAAALEDEVEHMEERNAHIKFLRDKLLDRLLQIPGSNLNGSLENRVPGNINIRFSGVSGSKLVTLCSLYGVYISSGSACNEGISEPSHVLKAIGLTDEEALSSIRITIGHTNTEEEIDQAADIITALVERIRNEEF
jgi:cysteine desulfurase